MVQIRLTKKFANDLKLKDLPTSKPVISVFDDWIIDNLILNRKKIAVLLQIIRSHETLVCYFSSRFPLGAIIQRGSEIAPK
jgi:hypothetical protein